MFQGEGVKRMTEQQQFSPGEKDAPSGQYGEVGPRGGRRGNREITHVKGEALPPTDKPGKKWGLVDLTKHKKR
jgi:hypothetical protein